MEQYDSRVDAYIGKSAVFAQPVLKYIRQVVHEISPLIMETTKWGMPFFDLKGPVCYMAAFKQHCGFGFWKSSTLDDPQKLLNNAEEGAGNFGRITSIDELPPKEVIAGFIRQAIARNEAGIKIPAKKTPPVRAELVTPGYLTEFLKGYPTALAVFDQLSYSHKKEYIDWITEAKTEATRQKRLETAAAWLAEGKSRNWKYK